MSKRMKYAEPSRLISLHLSGDSSKTLNNNGPELLRTPAPVIADTPTTRNTTARRAAQILIEKELGFAIPTAKQKKNLVVAFAKRDMIVYGKAFDIVRLSGEVDLNRLEDVEDQMDRITLYEIKSTAKRCGREFRGYFFAITAAELLVSQSLKSRFKFVFVDIHTKEHLELSLSQMFARAKGIYPTWSVLF